LESCVHFRARKRHICVMFLFLEMFIKEKE
jgi:hypothetical protein